MEVSEKYSANRSLIVIYIVIIVFAVILVPFMLSKDNNMYTQFIFAVSFGVPVGIICFANNKIAFFIIFLTSSFMFFFNRLIPFDIPFGALLDGLLVITSLGIIIRKKIQTQGKVTNYNLVNPVSILLFIWILYLVFQVINPAGNISAWAYDIRGIIGFLLGYFIIYHTFNSFNFLELFTKAWLFVAILAALYALYQEFFGLPVWDLRWVTENETRIGLNFIQGKWRKWSFLSDVAAFGLFMAFSSIFSIIKIFGEKDIRKKYFYGFAAILMIIAMIYSSTRAAYAMLPIGLGLFFLMNMNNLKVLTFAVFFVGILVILIYGPFYSGTLVRIRSTFNPQEDPSMEVRDENRSRIQPYIHSHPLGGGPNTSGEFGLMFCPWHPLAGFPPDSDYLETALELGWIGLIIRLSIFVSVVIIGVNGYYKLKNPKKRYMYLAYTCAFFALTIAAYAKKAINQYPLYFIIVVIYILFPRIHSLPEKE